MPRATRPKGAPHFTWIELGSPPSSLRPNARRLARALEALRNRAGDRPLRVLSGYRTAAHNRAVGGAPQSWHLRALAADIPGGYATVDDALACGFTGIGVRDGKVVHVDLRPTGVTIFDD